MTKVNYTDFESIKDIINEIKVNYEQNNVQQLEKLGIIWKETVGNNISKISKIYSLSENGVLTVICSDSHVANELYFVKKKLLRTINDRINEKEEEIKDIVFNYKRWKENNEKE